MAGDIKSDLAKDRDETEMRMRRVVQAMLEAWYHRFHDRAHVFDKGRMWASQARLFEWLFPDSLLVICVRDLRDVFASVEKQHAKTAIFDDTPTPLGRTLMARANAMFADDGMIGSCVRAVDDLLRRKPRCVHVIRYEDLVAKTKTVLFELHEALKEPQFAYNIEDVKDAATDLDALYFHKFPHHDSSGPVTVRPLGRAGFISPDIEHQIATGFLGYNQAFGYK